MPKISKPLTNTEIKSAKKADKEYSLHDGGGLYLLVKSNGSKIWRFSYSRPYTKKRALISFGQYPTVTLASARKLRDEAKEMLSQNRDPQQDREAKAIQKAAEIENIFSNVAFEWFELKKSLGIRPITASTIKMMLDNHIIPAIGNVPITELTPKYILRAFDYLKEEGKSRTHYVSIRRVREILDYAVNSGSIPFNPAQSIIKAVAPYKNTPFKTIKANELPEFWEALNRVVMEPQTRLLIEWLMLTMVRPNEACGTRWDEIDIDNRTWAIPAERMKSKRAHTVALSKQAIKILEEMKKFSSGQIFVFASPSKSVSHIKRGTIGIVLKRANTNIVPHGFRSLASTTMNEHGFNPDVIEAALAHVDKNAVRRIYNRSVYLEQRFELMEWWGDFLDTSKKGKVDVNSKIRGLKLVI
ncbi:tyrosine-type recombinase/integrase [Xenorhabdus bovienii]|uniref:tyrosine-type recombinase/integrase n=2 Tax=Xenorhabdus bovienii TaxID=40576 RepID=UPI0023B2F2EA|nr:tyrosine-type recombinase/integrase [Xenorhabdus bovienii]MDE9483090.1 tyrosine-type recombinase/integrase [Xenorhabdus bovienii]MDE9495500.1 tyrosine-type recombinase/integrase [Xenorhabdus bovienii]MDE9503924.1 tyrosine-type recombinase/integrase [Xenorhabdus bovienii]MDE9526728.1 tyrosine-type recombinase/integrase [Xenorhabdus bovienii]MDE9570368.1 tyrosine-type recombinase/integrase [Xenorhabdus bovienii]